MIKVINKKQGVIPKKGQVKVYIGRPSPLGNPFKIGEDGTREEVIKKYEIYIKKRIREKDPHIITELKTILNLTQLATVVFLECWCFPEPCHGDVIKHIIEQASK